MAAIQVTLPLLPSPPATDAAAVVVTKEQPVVAIQPDLDSYIALPPPATAASTSAAVIDDADSSLLLPASPSDSASSAYTLPPVASTSTDSEPRPSLKRRRDSVSEELPAIDEEMATAATMSATDVPAPSSSTSPRPPMKNAAGGSVNVFQCTGFGDCKMTFTRSEHLARHIRKHTGERPFRCHCGRTFSRLDNVRQHASTVHSETPAQNAETMAALVGLHNSLSARASMVQLESGMVLKDQKRVSLKDGDAARPAKKRNTTPRSLAGHNELQRQQATPPHPYSLPPAGGQGSYYTSSAPLVTYLPPAPLQQPYGGSSSGPLSAGGSYYSAPPSATGWSQVPLYPPHHQQQVQHDMASPSSLARRRNSRAPSAIHTHSHPLSHGMHSAHAFTHYNSPLYSQSSSLPMTPSSPLTPGGQSTRLPPVSQILPSPMRYADEALYYPVSTQGMGGMPPSPASSQPSSGGSYGHSRQPSGGGYYTHWQQQQAYQTCE